MVKLIALFLLLTGWLILVRPAAAQPNRADLSACTSVGNSFARAAQLNSTSIDKANWAFFPNADQARPDKPGWRVYLPLIQRTISSTCSPESAAFAESLSRWQGRNRIGKVDGVMSSTTASAMVAAWQRERVHIRRNPAINCVVLPRAEAAPVPRDLQHPQGGSRYWLEANTLKALEAMRLAYKAETGSSGPELLLVSGWRTAEGDRSACKKSGNCTATTKATSCSAHWSGTAIDIWLPNQTGPVNSRKANRIVQSQSVAYQWLVMNAARFGFVNYPFEPWHWEFQGNVVP